MPTSIRLDPRAERLLRRLAKARGQTKSDVVRAAIEALAGEAGVAAQPGEPETAFDRIADAIGVADSGGAHLSEDTGEAFRRLVAARASARGSR